MPASKMPSVLLKAKHLRDLLSRDTYLILYSLFKHNNRGMIQCAIGRRILVT